MAKTDPAKLKKVSVSLPFGIGRAEWEADPAERRAAWSLYVELVTRVAIQPLGNDQGLDREALSSLHTLFATTREILKSAGPDVGSGRESVGGIAIAVLNRGLRPFLAHWHPLLDEWEAERDPGVGRRDHERAWPRREEFRTTLAELRRELEGYAAALAAICGGDAGL